MTQEDSRVLFQLFGFIPVTAMSVLDFLIVTLIIYRLLTLIRGNRGAHMLVGLFVLVSAALTARWREEMMAVAWMLEQVQSILLILLVILFQPELRRLLLAIGQSPSSAGSTRPGPRA